MKPHPDVEPMPLALRPITGAAPCGVGGPGVPAGPLSPDSASRRHVNPPPPPCRCPSSSGRDCIDGRLYEDCGAAECDGGCVDVGDCECECHEEVTPP